MRNLEAAFGDLRLHEITPALVEKFKAARAKEVKPATVNRDLMSLKRLYNLILKGKILPEAHIIATLPIRIGFLRENNARLRYLTDKEYAELLVACDRIDLKRRASSTVRAVPLKEIVITAVHTGMRLGEILNLKWSDVDLQGRVITIHEAKWGSSRHVPINSVLGETLGKIPRRLGSPYVFYHEGQGKRAGDKYEWIKRSWTVVLKEAGITNLRFHDLRHTTASWLVMRGVPLKTVQEILGHKSFQTTLRYAHLAPEFRTEAVERLCTFGTGHIWDTWPPGGGRLPLRPAANDGTPRPKSEGGGD
ncbi:MAG: site-specific integrase [Planctomycetes bacterium]|nr:site-specific integrase [Planctomycetota bacterium]